MLILPIRLIVFFVVSEKMSILDQFYGRPPESDESR